MLDPHNKNRSIVTTLLTTSNRRGDLRVPAHTDTPVLPDVVARFAAGLSVDPTEAEGRLLDQKPGLARRYAEVHISYGAGVKWDPADHYKRRSPPVQV